MGTQQSQRRFRASRGLTLVELSIALVIISIIALLGAPGYMEWTANARIRSHAEALSAAFRLAQSEAVSRNTQIDLIFTDDAPSAPAVTASATGRNWVIRVATPAAFIEGKSGAEAAGGVRTLASQSTVSFNGLGRLAIGANRVIVDLSHVTGGTRGLRVVVSQSGAVRLCDPALTNADPRACA